MGDTRIAVLFGVSFALFALLMAGGCSATSAECKDCSAADAGGNGGDGPGDDGENGGGRVDGSSGDATTADGSGGGPGVCETRTSYEVVRRPNVFFVLDKSSSMEGQPLEQATSALDQVAEAVAGDVRVGFASFPKSGHCSSDRHLKMGLHEANAIKEAYADLQAGGGTPTGKALNFVRTGEWTRDRDDPADAERRKAVVLITDGEPNDAEICQTVHQATVEAGKLADQGIPVYVVGFQAGGNPQVLDAIAQAGGTDAPGERNFYEASDSSGLATALLSIADGSVACSFQLDPAPPEGSSINVTVGGQDVSQGADNGYTFDDATGTVGLHGSACSNLQQMGEQGTTLEIDVGCPTCSLAGKSCRADGDCCSGTCEGGTCIERCGGSGEQCVSSDDCCGGTCTKEGDEKIGICVGQ